MSNPTQSSSAKTRQIAVAAVLLLLAVIGVNISQKSKIPIAPINQNTLTASDAPPDTTVTNAQLDAFDENGRKIRQLTGNTITFFDGDERYLVTQPHLFIVRNNDDKTQPVIWEATADNATAYQTSNIVDLFGNAVLYSENTPNGPTRIASEYLHINTERKFAQTDKAVTIHARTSVSHAVGMWADIDKQYLQLPARVKEIHEVHR